MPHRERRPPRLCAHPCRLLGPERIAGGNGSSNASRGATVALGGEVLAFEESGEFCWMCPANRALVRTGRAAGDGVQTLDVHSATVQELNCWQLLLGPRSRDGFSRLWLFTASSTFMQPGLFPSSCAPGTDTRVSGFPGSEAPCGDVGIKTRSPEANVSKLQH